MKYLIGIGFLVLFLGFLAGGNIYLSRRVAWFFSIEKTWILYISIGALSLLMFVGLMTSIYNTGTGWTIIHFISAVLIGVLLYLLLSVLLVDLFGIFIKTKAIIYGIVAVSLTLLVSMYGIWNLYDFKLNRIELPIEGLNKEIRAVHLSDIHLGHRLGKNSLEDIVDLTLRQKPDLVFITGDLFDGKAMLSEDILSPLKRIDVPVYYVVGNHDGYAGEEKVIGYLKKMNVIVMENEIEYFEGIQIIGLYHMLADADEYDFHASKKMTIKKALSSMEIDETKPSILLHHSPDGIKYANEKGVDLFLAGHTHAGQLFPITLIAKLMFPYNKGLHDYKGTKTFVSQGVGSFGPLMRIGTSSEIVVIDLIPK